MKKVTDIINRYYLFLFFFFISLFALAQVENCSNGRDDDGDGFIDCTDSDCSASSLCVNSFFGSSNNCTQSNPGFSMATKWVSTARAAGNHSTPAVGDVNNDGIPEVVTTNIGDQNTVKVLNGRTGEVLFQKVLSFQPDGSVAIANVIGDQNAEILVYQRNGNRMALYNSDLSTEIWSITITDANSIGIASFADFDGNGSAEIYYRNTILNAADGRVVGTGGGVAKEINFAYAPLAVDILPVTSLCLECEGLELVTGSSIYSVDEATSSVRLVRSIDSDINVSGTTYYPKYNPSFSGQFSSVSAADYDLDGNLDIILVGAHGTFAQQYNGSSTAFLWNVNGGEVTLYQPAGNDYQWGMSRVAVGDIDGDGLLNAVFSSNNTLYALDENFEMLWAKGIQGGIVGISSPTLFDLNGDGASEVIIRDAEFLYILDGENNSTLTSVVCRSKTELSYPIIADVDADGESEICVTCASTAISGTLSTPNHAQEGEVRVLESSNLSWLPSRSVWNQHSYSVININDNLNVPLIQQNPTIVFAPENICAPPIGGNTYDYPNRPLNIFMSQVPKLTSRGCPVFALPDFVFQGNISSTKAACPIQTITVSYTIQNGGDAAANGALPISYYVRDPRTNSATFMATIYENLNLLQPGSNVAISHTLPGIMGAYRLYAVINTDLENTPITFPLTSSVIGECNTSNNIASVDVELASFEVSAEKVNDNIRCNIIGNNNGTVRAFYRGSNNAMVENIYIQNFEDANLFDQSQTGTNGWTSNVIGNINAGSYGVINYQNSQTFGAQTNGSRVEWSSQLVDISNHSNVSASVDVYGEGNFENSGSLIDTIAIRYELYNRNALLTSGTFPTSGLIIGDFTYRRLEVSLELLGFSNATHMRIMVRMTNTEIDESYYVDNVRIYGTTTPPAMELTESSGFQFYWFEPGRYSDTLYTGSTFTQLDRGTYEVISTHLPTTCTSDTASITIERSTTFIVPVEIQEVSPVTFCDIPNGSLRAFAYTSVNGEGEPEDTLTSTDGYTFSWRNTNDGTNTVIATGDTIKNLNNQDYTVDVVQVATGCMGNLSHFVSSNVVATPEPSVSVTNLVACNDTGILSASVGGNTSEYNFYWYDGNQTKPVEDFDGPVYEPSTVGEYTVVAQGTESGCRSNAVTVTLGSDAILPTPSVTSRTTNASCVTPDGSATLDADGQGTTENYDFTFYLGNTTLEVSRIPGTILPSANIEIARPYEITGLSQNTYTAIVTDRNNGCSDTLEFVINSNFSNSITELDTLVTTVLNGCDMNDRGTAFANIVLGDEIINGVPVNRIENLQQITSCNSVFQGDARETTGIPNGFQLTEARANQFGRTWLSDSVDLSQPFRYDFGLYLGTQDIGADGIALVMHRDPRGTDAVGEPGEYLGVGSSGNSGGEPAISPSVAIEFDTFENGGGEDPFYDHITVFYNGDVNSPVLPPTAILQQENNIFNIFDAENGDTLQVTLLFYMLPNGRQNMELWVESRRAVSFENDFINDVFGGESKVIFGFTASTGRNINDQAVFLTPFFNTINFAWYRGHTTSETARIPNATTQFICDLDPGDYTLVITGPLGCASAPQYFSIERESDNPVINVSSISHDNHCVDSVGEVTITTSSTEKPDSYTYQIYNGHNLNSQRGSNQTVSDGTIGYTFTGLPPGDFRINVINDDLQCESYLDITINNTEETPEINTDLSSIISNTACGAVATSGGYTIAVVGSIDPTDYEYQAYRGITISGTSITGGFIEQNDNPNPLSGDTYTAQVREKTTGCISDPFTFTIPNDEHTPNIVIVQISPDSDCGEVGGNGSLRAYVTNDPTDNCTECTENYNFQWYMGTTKIIDGVTLTNGSIATGSATDSISGLNAGTYSVEVTHNQLDCSRTSEHILTEQEVYPVIVVRSVNDNKACQAGLYTGEVFLSVTSEGNLVNNPSDNDYVFHWFKEGVQLTADTTENIDSLENATYQVVTISPFECVSDTLTAVVGRSLVNIVPSAPLPVTAPNTVCDPNANGIFPDNNGSILFIPLSDNIPSTNGYSFSLSSAGDPINNNGTTLNYNNVRYDTTGNRTNVTGLSADNYAMTITDEENGCQTTYSFTIIDSETPLSLNLSGITRNPNTNCGMDVNGMADASNLISGSIDNIVYRWTTQEDPSVSIDSDHLLNGEKVKSIENATFLRTYDNFTNFRTRGLQDVILASDIDNNNYLYTLSSTTNQVHGYILGGASPYSLETANYQNSLSINISNSINARGMYMNESGDRLYIIYSNSQIRQYDLSTNFDLSSAVLQGSITLTATSDPRDITFNPVIDRMFILDDGSNEILTYALRGSDITTANANYLGPATDFSIIQTQDGFPTGIIFNGNGTKMYLLGISTNSIHEYHLNTPYDLSTASYPDPPLFISVRGTGSLTGLWISPDESIAYVVTLNNSISRFDIADPPIGGVRDGTYLLTVTNNETGCSSPVIDVVILSESSQVDPVASNLTPNTVCDPDRNASGELNANGGITFSPMSVLNGVRTQSIYRFVLETTGGTIIDNDGTTSGFEDVSYPDTASQTDVIGLSAGNYVMSITDTTTQCDIRYNFSINNQADDVFITAMPETIGPGDTPDPTTNIIVFPNTSCFGGIFTGRARVLGNEAITGGTGNYRYDWTTAEDVTNIIDRDTVLNVLIDPSPLSQARYTGVQSSDLVMTDDPTSVSFNPDGTKMYLIDRATSTLYEYLLTTPYGIANIDSSSNKSENLNSLGAVGDIEEMEWNNDGSRLFLIDGGDNVIYGCSLTTAYDISSISLTQTSALLDREGETLFTGGLTFNDNGRKLYVCGDVRGLEGQIREYDLSRPYDLTSFVNTSLINGNMKADATSIYTPLSEVGKYHGGSRGETHFQDIMFNGDGTILYAVGNSGNAVYLYNLTSAYDVSTMTYSGIFLDTEKSETTSPTGITFNDIQNKLYVVGRTHDRVSEYDLFPQDYVTHGNYVFTVTDNITGCSVSQNVEVPNEQRVVTIIEDSLNLRNNTICEPDFNSLENSNSSIRFIPLTNNYTINDVNQDRFEYTFELTQPDSRGNITDENTLFNDYGNIFYTPRYNILGDTISTVTGLPEGNYRMTITEDFSQCQIVHNFSIIGDVTTGIPTINFNLIDREPNVSCIPDVYTGSANVVDAISGGITNNYEYFWATAEDTDTRIDNDTLLNDVQGGEYILIVNEATTRCTADAINVTIDDVIPIIDPGASVPSNNTVCNPDANGTNDDANGTIRFNPTTDLSPRTYIFTLKTSGGTTISSDGGTSGFEDVSYSDTASTALVTGLPADNYIMTITDTANQCSETYNFTVSDDFTDVPMVDATNIVLVPNTSCDTAAYTGTADVSSAITGGSGTYVYSWAAANATNIEIDTDPLLDNDVNGRSGVVHGNYVLNVTDAERGCIATVTPVTIVDDRPPIVIDATLLSIDFSCVVSSPTGSVTAQIMGGNNAGHRFEWYNGTSAVDTVLQMTFAAANTLTGQKNGYYTIKVIDTLSTCSETATLEIPEDIPTINIALAQDQAQTECNPANGQATVTATSIFDSPPPIGHTDDFGYQWYMGENTSTPLVGDTSAVLNAVEAGYYTLVVTEKNSGCESVPDTIRIMDNTPAPPDINLDINVIPSSCNAGGGELQGSVTVGTGPFTFFWYEGSENFAELDPNAENDLEDGDTLRLDTMTLVGVSNVTATSSDLTSLLSGIYTFVVQDGARCRYQETVDLPFNGIQTTTTLSVNDVTLCPDNGIARVRLSDNVTVTATVVRPDGSRFITLEPYTSNRGAEGIISNDDGTTIQLSVSTILTAGDEITGTNSGVTAIIATVTNVGYGNGQSDDIREYEVYLYSGSGVPVDRFTSYPITNSGGQTLHFPYHFNTQTGAVTDGMGMNIGTSPAPTAGSFAQFSNLPAGPYTAIARENPTTTFGGSDQCWTTSANETLTKRAFEPIIRSAVINNDTYCDPSTGNGSIEVIASKFVGDTIQNDGFTFNWHAGSNTSASRIETGTSTMDQDTIILSGRQPGEYTVSIIRGLPVPGRVGNECEITATYTIVADPESHTIINADITNNRDCDPLNGAATITDAFITDSASNYVFRWYQDADPSSLNTLIDNSHVPTGNATLGANSLSNIEAGIYYLQAERDTSKCMTNVFQVDIEDERVNPLLQLTTTQLDQSCDDVNPTGDATIDVIDITSTILTPGDYTFTWYTDSDLTNSLDNANIVDVPGPPIVPVNNGTAGANQAEELRDSTYYVVVEDVTNSIGCNATLTVEINQFNPNLSVGNVAGTDFNITHKDDCNPVNGAYEILRIRETTINGMRTNAPLADYRFTWYIDGDISNSLGDANIVDDPGPPIELVNNGDPGANQAEILPEDTYYVEVELDASPLGCEEIHQFTIDDNSRNPILRLSSTEDDEACDNTLMNTGTARVDVIMGATILPANDYTFTWYTDSDLTNRLDNANIVGVDNGDPGANRAEALEEGTYYVIAEDAVMPNIGCMSDTLEVEIDQFNPAFSIGNVAGMDFNITHKEDCDLVGTYEILRVMESTRDGTLVPNTNLTDYEFTWYRDLSVGAILDTMINGIRILDTTFIPSNPLPDANIVDIPGPPIVPLDNGDPGANRVSALDDGMYYVLIHSPSTGCGPTGLEQVHQFTINDNSQNPILQLSSTEDDEACDNALTNTGTAEVNVVSGIGTILTAGEYTFTWYTDSLLNTMLLDANIAGGLANGDPGANQAEALEEGTYYVIAVDAITPNMGCMSDTLVVEIEQFNPVFSIGNVAGTDFNITHKDDCNPVNGAYEISRVMESIKDGTSRTNTAPFTNFTFTWYTDSDLTNSLPDADIVGGNNGVAGATGANGLDTGTYYVVIANTTTGCRMVGEEQIHQFTINDSTDFPTLLLTLTQDDEACDNTFTNTGTARVNVSINGVSQNSSDYSFNWLANDSITPLPDANIAGFNNGTAGANQADSLQEGTYYVFATDSTNHIGCMSETIIVEIDQFNPVFSVGNVSGTDFTITHNDNCDPENGAYEISRVTESTRDGTTINTTPITDFVFTWYTDSDLTNRLDTANIAGGLDNGVAGANQAENLSPATYYLTMASAVTGCPSSGEEIRQFTIDDNKEIPIIQLVSSDEDTYCDDGGNFEGDGSISVSIIEEGSSVTAANYSVQWYRGSHSTVPGITDDDFLYDDAANPSGTNGGTSTQGANILQLNGLSQGKYTVFAIKTGGISNNVGCSVSAIFEIRQMQSIPIVNLDNIQGRVVHDALCNGSNGTIIIEDSDVPGRDLGIFEISILNETGGPVGSSPYTNTTTTSIMIDSLEKGLYFISMTDTTNNCMTARGNIAIDSVEREPSITLNGSIVPNNNCAGGTNQIGSIALIIDTQFTEADHFTVNWINTGTNDTIGNTAALTGLLDGTYRVTITNDNTGCDVARIYEIANDTIIPSISNTSITHNGICDEDGDGTPLDNGAFSLMNIISNGGTLNRGAINGLYTLEIFSNESLETTTMLTDNNAGTPYVFENLSSGTYYAVIREDASNCASQANQFIIEDDFEMLTLGIELVVADSSCIIGNVPRGALRGILTLNNDTIADSNADYDFQWYLGVDTSTPLVEGMTINGFTPVGVNTANIEGLAVGTFTLGVTKMSTGCIVTETFALPNIPTISRILNVSTTTATTCNPSNGEIIIDRVNRGNLSEYSFDYYDTEPVFGVTPIFTGAGGRFENAKAGSYWIIGLDTTVDCSTPAFRVEVDETITYPEISESDYEFQRNCDPSNPNGRISINVSNGGSAIAIPNPDYTIRWYFGGDTTNALDTSDHPGLVNLQGEFTHDLRNIPAGSFTVSVQYNPTGCAIIETFSMVDDTPNPLTISTSASGNINCKEGEFNGQMAVSIVSIPEGRTSSDYEYRWSIGNLATADTMNPDYRGSIITELNSGNYVVVVLDTIDIFCKSAITQVNVPDITTQPEFDVNVVKNLSICVGEPDGFAELVYENELSNVDIKWTNTEDTVIGTNHFIGSLDAGFYGLTLTNRITECQSDVLMFTILNEAVTPDDPSVIVNSHRMDCTTPDGSAIANTGGLQDGFLFEWFEENDLTTPYAIGAQVDNMDSTTYLIRATNISTGCTSALSAPTTFDFIPVEFEYEIKLENSLCLRTEEGSTSQFTGSAFISFIDGGIVATNYEWRDSDNNLASTDPTLIDAAPDTYIVSFRVNNCTFTDSLVIGTSLTVYNGISVNGDSQNDFLLLDCVDEFPNNNVKIFNRSGVRVFEINSYDNLEKRFSGAGNVGGGGLDLPPGTYFFVIDLRNGSEPVQGFIELIR